MKRNDDDDGTTNPLSNSVKFGENLAEITKRAKIEQGISKTLKDPVLQEHVNAALNVLRKSITTAAGMGLSAVKYWCSIQYARDNILAWTFKVVFQDDVSLYYTDVTSASRPMSSSFAERVNCSLKDPHLILDAMFDVLKIQGLQVRRIVLKPHIDTSVYRLLDSPDHEEMGIIAWCDFERFKAAMPGSFHV